MKPSDLREHPLASDVPELAPADYAELVRDVRRRGFTTPLDVTSDGVVLDGRTRLRIAVELGFADVPARIVAPEDGYAYMLLAALQRRHLSASQKAWTVTALDEHQRVRAEAAERTGGRPRKADPKPVAPVPPVSKTRDVAARKAGVGARTVQDAETVRGAIRRGELPPETDQQVRDGKANVKPLAQTVRRRREQAQQAEAAPLRATVYHQNAVEFLAGVPAGSVDLLLTDPPYMTDVDDLDAFVDSWLVAALSKLKPTGRAYIFTGSYPEELYSYLDVLLEVEALTHSGVLVWTYRNTLGPSPATAYKTNWQAIHHLHGPEAAPLAAQELVERFSVQDVAAPDGRHGTRDHAWQKPDALAERLVRHSTKPGDTIIDPFAGTGTFLAAGARLGRHASGSELDEAMIRLCHQHGIRDASELGR